MNMELYAAAFEFAGRIFLAGTLIGILLYVWSKIRA